MAIVWQSMAYIHFGFLGSARTANEVSFHPPHLMDSSGSLTPAALIPFCSYQANMSMIGDINNNLPFTACSQFRPTVLEGQRCYYLNLTSIDTGKSGKGKGAGLVIIIDIGVQNTDETQSEDSNENPLSLASSGVDASSARIYLDTLSSFTDSRAGSYAMTALKKMIGTDSFLKQTDEEKKCRIETVEDCQARSYIDRVQEKCGCVPWALSVTLASKV